MFVAVAVAVAVVVSALASALLAFSPLFGERSVLSSAFDLNIDFKPRRVPDFFAPETQNKSQWDFG